MKTVASILLFATIVLALGYYSILVEREKERKEKLCEAYSEFECTHFRIEGRNAVVVKPGTAAEGNPWVWRALFFGHQPQVDLQLLSAGYHVGFVDTTGLFGSQEAIEIWNSFYHRVVTDLLLSERVALEGMSRGALPLYRWASANADRVCAIYADAPVTDLCSWPAGTGKGRGSKKDWAAVVNAYGSEAGQMCDEFPSPIHQLEPLAVAQVPILHVVGDADDIVPVAENTDVVVERYRALGGNIRVISKAGVGHHPHGLYDPAPIVNFLLSHCGPPRG